MTTIRISQVRLNAAQAIKLDSGAHDDLNDGACFMELESYVAGLPWSSHPPCSCPVLAAFLRRYNDVTDQAGRDEIKARFLGRTIGTAGDGYQQVRGYMAADWAVRVALPVWLDMAGATVAAESLRSAAAIVDSESARAGHRLVREACAGLPEYWQWRTGLREKVSAAVLEALKGKATADVATVAAAAVPAAAAADAAAAAAAAADDAADAAVANAAAAAAYHAAANASAADAVAHAAGAAAAGTAAAADADTWNSVYGEIYAAVRAQLKEMWAEKLGPGRAALKESAMELVERMIALGEEERTVVINGAGEAI